MKDTHLGVILLFRNTLYPRRRRSYSNPDLSQVNISARSQPPSQSEWDSMQKDPVGILTSEERWNQYRIPKLNNKIIQAKLVVTAVFQFPGKFDQEGEPFYIVTSVH